MSISSALTPLAPTKASEPPLRRARESGLCGAEITRRWGAGGAGEDGDATAAACGRGSATGCLFGAVRVEVRPAEVHLLRALPTTVKGVGGLTRLRGALARDAGRSRAAKGERGVLLILIQILLTCMYYETLRSFSALSTYGNFLGSELVQSGWRHFQPTCSAAEPSWCAHKGSHCLMCQLSALSFHVLCSPSSHIGQPAG